MKNKRLKRYALAVSSFESLVLANVLGLMVNGLSIAMNLWALLHGVYSAGLFVAVSSIVTCLQMATLFYARHRARLFKQELAEAKAKRTFAEQMLQKLKTATGFSMPIPMDDDDDKVRKH